MNLSNLAHAGLSLLAQIIIAGIVYYFGCSLTVSTIMGGLFSIGFYYGREVAQSERKLGTPPWWIGFNMALWSKDAIFDFVCPVIACLLLVILTILL